MAQVRGQGTELAGRHAEDEENDDGWSDVVLIAPRLFAPSFDYGAFFLRVTPEVPWCDRWRDKEMGSTT